MRRPARRTIHHSGHRPAATPARPMTKSGHRRASSIQLLYHSRMRLPWLLAILVAAGEAERSKHGKEGRARVGDVFKPLKEKQILVGGHTDDAPIHTARFPSNWELSTARAVNVVHFLADAVGVDPAKLTAAGYS